MGATGLLLPGLAVKAADLPSGAVWVSRIVLPHHGFLPVVANLNPMNNYSERRHQHPLSDAATGKAEQPASAAIPVA